MYLLKKFLIVFCCFIPVLSFAQDWEAIDSMQNLLKDYGKDTNSVKTLNEIAWKFLKYHSDSCKSYAEKALVLANEINFPQGATTSLNRIGNSFEKEGEPEVAITYYGKAFTIDSQLNHVYGMGRAKHQIGIVYKKKGEYDAALKYENIGISYLRQGPPIEKNQILLAQIYNSIGNVYRRQGNFQKALTAYDEALNIRSKFVDPGELAKTYTVRALLFENLAMYQSALESHRLALNIYENSQNVPGIAASYNNIGNLYFGWEKNVEALAYYQRSKVLKENLSDELSKAITLYNIGAVYQEIGNHDEALPFFYESLSIRKTADAKGGMAESHLGIGKSLFAKENYEEADRHLTSGMLYAVQTSLFSLQVNILEQKAALQQASGNKDQALTLFLKAASLKDSLTNVERQAIDFEKQLSDARKMQNELAKEVEFQKEKTSLRTQLAYAIGGGSALLLIAAFFSMSSFRQKQRAKIAEQEARLGRNEIDDLLKNQEIKIMSAMVEGQDEERKRIAQDLHDRLGGILSVVRLHFSAVESNIHKMEAKNQEQYAIATELLNEASETVRAISHDIGDSMLMTLGLVPALQDMANTIEASQTLQVSVIHHGMNERLPSQMEIHLYKIVQELMSNILKHAEANHVSINLVRSGDQFSILVEDDGVGFDLDDPMNREGMGMVTMRARAKELEGTISIDSQPDHGTTTTFEMAWPTLENSLI